jgi:hypothetical protein
MSLVNEDQHELDTSYELRTVVPVEQLSALLGIEMTERISTRILLTDRSIIGHRFDLIGRNTRYPLGF